MTKYTTDITLEVEAETEEKAVRKMYDRMAMGEVKLDLIEEVDEDGN